MPAAQDRAPGNPVEQLQPISSLEMSFSTYQCRIHCFSLQPSLLSSAILWNQSGPAFLSCLQHTFSKLQKGLFLSQAVIPKPKLSFPVAQFSRSGLWSCFSCDPRWSRGCCPHHLLLFLSSAVVTVISPCAPHTGPTLSADPQSTSSAGLGLHPAHPVLGLKHLHPLGAP